MSLNARTTTLSTITNALLILAVTVVVAITKNPVAILALFFMRDLPVFQDQVGIDQLRQLGIIDGPDGPEDHDGESRDSEYGGTKTGFTARL